MKVPTFTAFFSALRRAEGDEYPPFPWQSALADRVRRQGWPDQIGVPTGLGKTACIDIAVWAMASSHEAPTRLWYVVNRRLLVDAAAARATAIAEHLASAERGPLRMVADALRARSALGLRDDVPLHVSRLRGGVPLDASAPDPSQPTIHLATVPMYGSRLLLRGYGVSTGMRPIAAAHAGIDALVLLDEAHLAAPLRRLVDDLAETDPGDPVGLLPAGRARPRIVELTATGDDHGDRFDLTAADHDHPIVRQRVRASKPTRLVTTKRSRLSRALAEQAVDTLVRDGRDAVTCVVFVNTAASAPEVAHAVQTVAARVGIVVQPRVLTGRFRAEDATSIRDELLGPRGVASGWHQDREGHLVVVATQTLEVGADLDFEHLVTETAGIRALVQRFGRLNRLGQRNDVASAVVVHVDDANGDPVYGDETTEAWRRLVDAAGGVDGESLDLGPSTISRVLGVPGDASPSVPSLLPHHVWEWSKTSADQRPPTPVEPFIVGHDDTHARVTVLWRWWVPTEGAPLLPRPNAAETIDLPIGEVREFLESLGAEHQERWCRLASDGLTGTAVGVDELRPGDVVVLPVGAGGYSPHSGWDPSSSSRVTDLAVAAGHVVIGGDSPTAPPPSWGLSEGDTLESVRRLLDGLRVTVLGTDETADRPVEEVVDDLVSVLSASRPEIVEPWPVRPRVVVTDGIVVLAPQPGDRRRSVDVRVDAFDDLSFGAVDAASARLAEHLAAVAAAADAIAGAIGLPDVVRRSVSLAASLHDVGKEDLRFQRVLDPQRHSEVPLAKSLDRSLDRRRPTGWPRGGRHEELSGRAVRAWLDAGHGASAGVDEDLVVHLVVSHHGHGRPLVRPVMADSFGAPVPVSVAGTTVTIEGDLSAVDWGQPARFRRLCERYGTWGLALLEAVVRQADHAASAVAGRGGR